LVGLTDDQLVVRLADHLAFQMVVASAASMAERSADNWAA
jgi:hypothetical protein